MAVAPAVTSTGAAAAASGPASRLVVIAIRSKRANAIVLGLIRHMCVFAHAHDPDPTGTHSG